MAYAVIGKVEIKEREVQSYEWKMQNQNSIKSVSQKVKSHKADDTDLKRKERKKKKKKDQATREILEVQKCPNYQGIISASKGNVGTETQIFSNMHKWRCISKEM